MRLATYNILHGRSPADDRVDVERFAAAAASLDADVLGLQEVDRDQPRSGGADLTAAAAEAMGAPHHRFVAALAGTPGATWAAATGQEQPGTAAYGVALLSRHPVSHWRAVRLPQLRRTVPVWFPGRRRPTLVTDEPRVAVCAVIEAPDGPMTVAVTHLSFVPGWNTHQLRHLARVVRTLPRPAVLMGDLNMGPAAAARTTRMRPLATAATFPVEVPVRQLDHVLAGGDLVATGPASAPLLPVSDHRPLVVDVERVGAGRSPRLAR